MIKYICVMLMVVLLCGVCCAEWMHCPVCECDYKKGEDESQHGKGKWCDKYMVRTTAELNHMDRGNFTGGLPVTGRGLSEHDKALEFSWINDKLLEIEDSLDKLHSMIADLHIKQEGVKRYEQICPKGKDYIKDMVQGGGPQ